MQLAARRPRMIPAFQPGITVSGSDLSAPAAFTVGDVTDDPGRVTEQRVGVVAEPVGSDGDDVEHTAILYPADRIVTTDGTWWSLPNDGHTLTLPRVEPWTREQLFTEHLRQSRLRLWQKLAS